MRDITLCHPRLQALAGRLVEECNKQGLKIKIGETLRTVAEQDALYAQGRTKPGPIVTNAPGSNFSSYHQWGTAFDFFRNDGRGAYYDNDGFFTKVGKIGVALGLEWGGNWKSPVDKPHFQLSDWGSTTAGIKRLYRNPDEFMRTWEPVEERIGWISTPNGWWYRRPNGSYPANKWEVINHRWYLFNGDGYMCTSWHRWNGSVCDPEDGSGDWYYFDPTSGGPLEGACWRSRENGAMEIWFVDQADSI
ncbi:M15 family metallopeptidase [Hungatella sp. L12]|uniref:M15 family metallopeptidase n=1 Tax=Hungatella hominis TaxID=2763050 RepID=A0ABR7H7F5_9FIRM|nr:M15 family metallopeptidase [Hungatella hominis]MBC5709130.1 M15 family metallopeptidase [Hungatella hominis]